MGDATAIITGAGGTIGRELASVLGQRGFAIVAVDRDGAAAEVTAKQVVAAGGRALAQEADVADEQQVEAYVDAAVARFGRIDMFANNAGIEGPAAPIVDFPGDGFRQVLEVNVTAVFLGLKHVLPVMVAQGGGTVVNTASVAGLYATPQLVAYGASKHAVIGITRTAAVEHAADGIRVNAVCPGPQEGRMMTSIEALVAPEDPAGAREGYMATIPTGRYGKPAEIAETMAWLLADAPPYLTGQTIVVDGGLLIS